MTIDFAALAAEFPREAIHWRAQTLTRNGDKALALAYLDARDVMDRLDQVCGPENWQSRYVETPKGRVLCEIGIRCDSEWVWKSDGAGDTAVEGEKGGISDSLKRAAVQWGIGRYLYRLDAVWAPCETYERNGKKQWSAWKGSPWDHVRGGNKPASKPAETAPAANAAGPDWAAVRDKMLADIPRRTSRSDMDFLLTLSAFQSDLGALKAGDRPKFNEVRTALQQQWVKACGGESPPHPFLDSLQDREAA